MASELTISPGDKSVLVPLTNSLYVRGELSDPEHVIVDVGTGFYVEKACSSSLRVWPICVLTPAQDTQSAERFYEAKVQNLMNNIQDLEVIVQRKTLNVRSVEDGKFHMFLEFKAGHWAGFGIY